MEVHHHTHTTAGHDPSTLRQTQGSGYRGRKKFFHYFWEFFMLFLAVTAGFFVENQREHMVEHGKENQYIKSLINDLETDIKQINTSSLLKEKRINTIDSVFLFFETHRNPQKIPVFVRGLMLLTAGDRHMERNTITINQLKNAGNMRLIRRKNVTDSIATYDLQWERLELYIQTYFANQQINYDYIEKIIKDYTLLPFYRNNNSAGQAAVNLPDSTLIQINPSLLLGYFNFLSRQKAITIQENRAIRNQEKRAIMLIDLMKQEYHLK